MRYIVIILSGFIMVCISATCRAQDRSLVEEGNRLYQQKKYKEAMDAYMEALKKNPSSVPGMFNLSNAMYQLGQTEQARTLLENTIKSSKDSNITASAQYNIGNTFMSQRNWDGAIEAYKKALRLNPQDANAKYNLSYALAMKQKEDQNKKNDQKNKDGKDNKEKKDDKNKQDNKNDKDKQEKDKQDKDKQDKENKDKQDKGQGDQEQQKQEPQPSKMSEQKADQMLKILQQDEKDLRDKKQKAKGVPVKLQKDW